MEKQLIPSQQLLANVNYEGVIKGQIEAIQRSGFVPHEIYVSRQIYEIAKIGYCQQTLVKPEDIELKRLLGLNLRILENERYFNNSSMDGFIFPIVVTMKLPEVTEYSEENEEDEDETNGHITSGYSSRGTGLIGEN